MHSTGNRQPTTDNRSATDYRLLLLALALCAGILVCTLKLWQADLRVPLVYYGEAKYNALLIKTVMDHGWHLRNPSMGMPDGLDLRDVPMSDNNLHLAAIKLLGLFSTRYGRVLNLFFLLTFPLVTASALYVLRHFGASRLSAVFVALLYTFLPYHFVRGEHHLFLAAYFTVPLAVMMALWVAAGAVAPRSR
jgi:phosphoglycerol transferase